MDLPALTRIRQRFEAESVADVTGELCRKLDGAGVSLRPGDRVAIAVGSRGIANIAVIAKGVADWVRVRQARPFIVPSMGSHGGATAEGQKHVLESLGVTEQYVGAPILSGMDVVELPQDDAPVRVYFDKNAYEADATIAVNRIKVHSDYHGRYESGLMKMLAIGLGKQTQAEAIHTYGIQGLRDFMPLVARQIIASANVVLGVAIVENAYDQTMLVEAIPAAEIPDREPVLLDIARANMPSLPVDDLDILIVDEMGKNISGTGMDTSIIGRMMIRGQAEPERPRIKIVVARDLTDETHGNALGMGLADIITRRLFDKIDFDAMYANVKTSTFLARANVPVIADDDRGAVALARRAAGPISRDELKIIRIRNTLDLSEILVSPAVLDLLDGAAIDVIGPASELLDGKGQLPRFDA